MDPRLPDFIVAGAQKSASTFVQDALSAHPDVYMPNGETRFFEDPEYGDGALAPLTALFEGRSERLVGIKRPDYLGREEVPSRVHRAVPGAKIVFVLRNPVDRLVSAYYHYVKFGFIPVMDINEALPKVLEGDALGNPKTRELLSYGNYGTHLARWYATFPASQIHVVLQEDIKRSADAVLAGLAGFLGLQGEVPAAPKGTANEGVYPLSRLKFLTRRNRFMYDYDPRNGKVIDRRMGAGTWLAAAAITAIDRYALRRVIGNERPRLDPGIRARLVSYYRDEVARTRELLGRDLQGWDTK